MLMNSVFDFVEAADTTILIGPHGGAREESNPDRKQPPTSLDPETSWLPLSTGISNQGKETNTRLVCIRTGGLVTESGTCEFFICIVYM